LTSGLIQAVRKKTAGLHVALRRNISAPVQVKYLVEVSKDAASLLVCTRKKYFCWGCGFVVSDVISRAFFGHLHLALGANHWMVVFRWSFYWKLGYNLSLLILWVTCSRKKQVKKKQSKKLEKKLLLGGCGYFVSEVISGGLLGHLGPLCLALGANR